MAWQEGFTQLPLFMAQPRGQIRNVMRGVRDGREVLLFDYSYAMGLLGLLLLFLSRSATSETRTYMYTVAACPVKQGTLPQFRMEPEGFLKRILGFLSDIDFPTHQEFFRRYDLRGSDPQAVRALFQPQVLDTLAAKPSRLCVEGSGNWLLAYRPGGTAFVKADPDEIRAFLGQALEVCRPFGE